MKHKIACLLFIGLCQCLFGQQNNLQGFAPLVNKTWTAQGYWGDGTPFKQEIEHTFALDSTLVITKTKGYTDKKQQVFGNRNHGIRQVDTATETILFWEFDVFGGLTKGTVLFQEKNIIYQYTYGDSVITDFWEYVNPETYNYTVGSFENGKWKQKYLQTTFKVKK